MSKQPLTNLNRNVIFVGKDVLNVEDELRLYGFPTDPGNTQPFLAYTVVSSVAEFKSLVSGAFDPSTPWAVVGAGMDENVRNAVLLGMRLAFGPERTVAQALAMRNNEYAINPRDLK